jgi:hypothetical protein
VGGGFSPSFNFDGVMSYAPDTRMQDLGHSYFQLFRDGKIECVDAGLLQPKGEYGKVIASLALEAACIACLARMFKLLRVLEVEPPALVMLTLLGVKSYRMALDPMAGYASAVIDRDALVITPRFVESYESDVAASILRTSFDSLWNAAGQSQCVDYDAAGKPSTALQTAIQRMG